MIERLMSTRDLTACNAGILLKLIRRKNIHSIAEAAKLMNCRRSAAAKLMNYLEELSLIMPGGNRKKSRRDFYAFNPGAATALGVDIRPGYMQFALTDLSGRILSEERVETENPEAREGALLIGRMGREILSRTPEHGNFLGAGVMVPGWVSDDGMVLNADPLGWNAPVRFRDLLAETVPFPIRIINDANALVLAESAFGSIGSVTNLLYIENPDDIGGAFVDGHSQLLTGENSLAMEIGKMQIHINDRFWKVEEFLLLRRILEENDLTLEDLKKIFDSKEGESEGLCRQISEAFGQIVSLSSALLNPYAIMIRSPYIKTDTALDHIRQAALRHIRGTPLKETQLLLPSLERSALGGACWAFSNSPYAFAVHNK